MCLAKVCMLAQKSASHHAVLQDLACLAQICMLLQVCPRPEVVEVWDVTAQDPKLLVYLKVCCFLLSSVNYSVPCNVVNR